MVTMMRIETQSSVVRRWKLPLTSAKFLAVGPGEWSISSSQQAAGDTRNSSSLLIKGLPINCLAGLADVGSPEEQARRNSVSQIEKMHQKSRCQFWSTIGSEQGFTGIMTLFSYNVRCTVPTFNQIFDIHQVPEVRICTCKYLARYFPSTVHP